MIELVIKDKPIQAYPNHPSDVLCCIHFKRDFATIGQVVLYNSSVAIDRAILDIFIEEEFRCLWLFKELAISLNKLVVGICKDKGIKCVVSMGNNPVSPKILKFFMFKEYDNNKFYRVVI